MMKILLLFIVTGIMMSACSQPGIKTQTVERDDQKEVVITNDMENAKGVVPGWLNENTVIVTREPQAHSGEYACLTNDSNQYSYYFKEIVKNLRSGVPKMATFSGWVYTTVSTPNFAIICNINENAKLYDWKAYPLDKELTKAGKWVAFSSSFYFDRLPLKPDMEIGIFAWNQSKKPVYIDDLKITFSY
ncbi:MAG: hypothetical protein Q7U54_13460 [Bacteroidales bacterium]|nr:hypothetical protein [Bacteroidales bacterium]